MNCVVCNSSHSDPRNFLLSCATCNKYFHHRHHSPPVSDQELVDRLKATRQGIPHKGLTAWTCVNCTPQKDRAIPGLGPGKAPPRRTTTHRTSNDDIQHDDEVIILDNDSPVAPASSQLIDLTLSDDDNLMEQPLPIPELANASHERPPAPTASENTILAPPTSFLAPPWINDDYTFPSSPLDPWERFRLAKPTLTSSSHHRRKPITKQHISHKPFHLSITSWMRSHRISKP